MTSRCGTTRLGFALALLLAGCGSSEPAPATTTPEKEAPSVRNKQDAVPPIFVDGSPVEPADRLQRWMADRLRRRPQVVLRLPFTFWAEPRLAALGLALTRDGAALHRLDDTALGISLADRLRRLRGGDERCVVWLSVRSGPLLGQASPDGPPVLSVMAVHERIPDDAKGSDLHAQASRGPEELAVRLLRRIHCARGTARCVKCREAADEPPSPVLLDVAPDGDAARPTIALEREGKTTYAPFDVLRRFASIEEARAFAARHELTDVKLDGEAE